MIDDCNEFCHSLCQVMAIDEQRNVDEILDLASPENRWETRHGTDRRRPQKAPGLSCCAKIEEPGTRDKAGLKIAPVDVA